MRVAPDLIGLAAVAVLKTDQAPLFPAWLEKMQSSRAHARTVSGTVCEAMARTFALLLDTIVSSGARHENLSLSRQLLI